MGNDVEILILKERIRIHELQIQALSDALMFANPNFYNKFVEIANYKMLNDSLLIELREELEKYQ